jgi:hypothetical protein
MLSLRKDDVQRRSSFCLKTNVISFYYWFLSTGFFEIQQLPLAKVAFFMSFLESPCGQSQN